VVGSPCVLKRSLSEWRQPPMTLPIHTVVAVSDTGCIVPPRGTFREIIRDYSPEARIIVETVEAQREIVPVTELLPIKYWRS